MDAQTRITTTCEVTWHEWSGSRLPRLAGHAMELHRMNFLGRIRSVCSIDMLIDRTFDVQGWNLRSRAVESQSIANSALRGLFH